MKNTYVTRNLYK